MPAGIEWDPARSKYRVTVHANGKQYRLGHVDTLMDAKVAVMIAKADIARGSQADLALRHGMAIPARDLHQHTRRKRFHPEHVTQRQLHRQWRHRTGLRTLKDEFFRGQDWQTFESFKADLDAYITHWNTTRRQVKSRA